MVVTFHYENGAARVVIEHSGWGEGEEWAQAQAWHQKAWKQVSGSLESALVSGKGRLCCAPEENEG